MIEEILKDLDERVNQIDFELDEMKEEQLYVDLSIEIYFKKIQNYPKSLKKIFDLGTTLLSYFEKFFQAWYNFQCDVQQKFYNYIYSNKQELILS